MHCFCQQHFTVAKKTIHTKKSVYPLIHFNCCLEKGLYMKHFLWHCWKLQLFFTFFWKWKHCMGLWSKYMICRKNTTQAWIDCIIWMYTLEGSHCLTCDSIFFCFFIFAQFSGIFLIIWNNIHHTTYSSYALNATSAAGPMTASSDKRLQRNMMLPLAT